MIQIQAVKKRGFLRQLGEGAKALNQPLREFLIASQSQIFTANFQRGRILVSTSGSGQSGSFEIGVAGKEFTQDNVFGMIEEFIELLDSLIAASTVTDTAETIDSTLASMFASDELTTCTQQGADFTMIGWPNQYGGAF